MKNISLTLLLLCLFSSAILSQETETETEKEIEKKIKVTVTIIPYNLSIGNPFTLSLLVDYPIPEDISVVVPKFEGSFTLENYVRSPKKNPSGVTQTQFEFKLIPNKAGIFEIESISVLTPNGIIQTAPVIFNIRGGQEGRITTLNFIWEAPQQITVGDRVTLILLSNSAGNENIIPLPSFFMPEVPRNVILTNSIISPQEKERGVVLKLTLIPLSAGNFNLPARTLNNENSQQRQQVRFVIPALNIRVTEKIQ